jgi:hypothetical protein
MKNSEIKKLVSKYLEIQIKLKKTRDEKLLDKLTEIAQRYFHETGRIIQSDLKDR